MNQVDDETLVVFIEESRAHLASIEEDLLAIEQMGEAVDEALVNKVFRAAHSIKGVAGFFGFSKVHELAHNAENVLSMLRSREMAPSPEAINILLLAFDKLRELINNIHTSNEANISDLLVALVGLLSSHLPEKTKPSVNQQVEIALGDGPRRMSVSAFELEREKNNRQFILWIDVDLIHDVQRVGKSPLDIFCILSDMGTVLNCRVDFSAVGTLDDPESNQLPLTLIFSTQSSAEKISQSLGVHSSHIYVIHSPASTQPEAVLVEDPSQSASIAVYGGGPVANAKSSMTKANVSNEDQDSLSASTKLKSSASSPPAALLHEETTGGSSITISNHDNPQIESSLRVNVELLESLMNLAGELVLSRNQLVEAISNDDKRAIEISGQRINLVTSELQEAIMQTRMQPIGNIFNRFPRVVRDLSRELKKNVRLSISGKEVEMDKTIIEGLGDPLMHMIRNAIDHGIELPEERIKAGKGHSGQISLKAYHEAGQVIIEFRDDGRGLDSRKIASAALARGAISSDQLITMSEKEILSLILLPGLSTSDKVTDLSGRGVGMDVVKTNLDKLGGKLDIESTVGQGTTFRIKLPLTLAIIPSLLVSVNEERFAIPQVNVDELIRISAAQVKNRIEVVGNAEVLVLRGQLIPVIHLADMLGIERAYHDLESGERKSDRRQGIADRRSRRHDVIAKTSEVLYDANPSNKPERRVQEPDRRYHANSDLNIVVVTGGAFQYGLVVEELHDTVEIVVKPLGRHLKRLREYAGATIMGDGKVALILDVAGLAAEVGLTSMKGSTRAQEVVQEAQRDKIDDVHSFLLFHNAPDEACVVPLGLVSRVEQIHSNQIETLAGKRTMQYRGATLPLLALNDVASVGELTAAQERVVIVFEISGKEVGVLAAKPVDAIDTPALIEQSTLRQKGIMGSAIIRSQTTLVVDVFELVETMYPEWTTQKRVALNFEGENPLILLAEDSDFFRSQVQKFLESDGWRVITAIDGQAAWELLQEHGAEVKLVVTDIEMPRLNGLELARSIHADPRFADLPIIALTSLAGEDDIARGQAAGVNDYQIKMDKEKLLMSVRKYVARSLNLVKNEPGHNAEQTVYSTDL